MDEGPLYRQIAEDLKRRIETGELASGDPLPTEEQLGEQYGNASRNTIREALKWLTTRGLIETQRGRGSRVATKTDPFVTTLSASPETGLGGGEGAAYGSEVEATSRRPSTTSPRVEVQQAAGAVAAELQLSEGSTVVCRHQQRSIDGTVWSLQTSFYPFDLISRGAQRLIEASDIEEGTVTYLDQKLGIRQAGYRDLITVRPPDDNETIFFKLPSDGRVAVVEISRTAFDDQARPFRLTVSVFPADRNKFLINVGNVPADAPKRDLS
ncbi:MAG TPA: GntR family transcriptional regulator [Streptosporangiaceae bacterium]|jgi:GntR family transcriptional regulator